MARIRTIKPDFFTSLTVADLTPEQRLTFIGLWTHVDDEGRCVDDPRLVKAAVWPLDDRSIHDIDADLDAIHSAGLITRYTLTEDSVNPHAAPRQRRFIAVTGWDEHQRINRPTESKIPPPDNGTPRPPTSKNIDSLNTHGTLTEDSLPERKGREQGKEQGTTYRSPHVTTDRARDSDELEPAPTGPGITGNHSANAYRLVDQAIGRGQPSSIRTGLAIEVATLLREYDDTTIQTALQRWNTRTGIGPRVLPSIVSDIVKEQAGGGSTLHAGAHTRGGGGAVGIEAKARGWLALGAEPSPESGNETPFRVIEGGRSA